MINNSLSNEGYFSYDHLVYVRIFEGCNLSCLHCFIPSNPKKINKDTLVSGYIDQALEVQGGVKEGSKVYIQWHGGEPTLMGAKYLRDVVEGVNSSSKYKYMHGIQTNLLNYSLDRNSWATLYRDHFNSMVGVSWDVNLRRVRGESLTNEERMEKYDNIFWNNVKLAQEDGLTLYMVITVTKLFFDKYKNPFDFFEFMVEKGINYINLERITKTGYARDNWDAIGLTNKEYSTGMARLYRFYKIYKENNPMVNLHISPFDGLESSVMSLLKSAEHLSSTNESGYGCWSGKCDTRFHTIDANGYKKGCTAINSEYDNKSSEIKSEKVIRIVSLNDIKQTRESRVANCVECEFKKICSSGCLTVEKMDESGECSGGKLLFQEIRKVINR